MQSPSPPRAVATILSPPRPTVYLLSLQRPPPPSWGISLSDAMDDPYLDTPLPVDTHRDVAPHSVSPQPESWSLPLPYTQLCILPVFSLVWPTRGSSTLVPTIVSPPIRPC
jgi:hypothetical protein